MELMGATVTGKTRSLTSLDLNDPAEARLASCARRIGQLLKSPAAAANADVESSLDDFLGAVYALIRAKHENFQDRPERPIAIKPVAQRAARIEAGNIKTDGRWIAGFYFNNALFRTAAVYHRILKVATGAAGYVPALQAAGLASYPNWNSIRLFKVHSQVNELKHEPQGVYHGRLVTYEDALTATCDLLDLIEAWATANAPARKK
jgi:hypothetical protein